MKKVVKALTCMSLFGIGSQVYAALPAAATTALGDVDTAITDTETALWPIIGAALVAIITIKLVKRFSNKV